MGVRRQGETAERSLSPVACGRLLAGTTGLVVAVWAAAGAVESGAAPPRPPGGLPAFPPVPVKAAVVMDADTARVLAARAAQRRLPPASLTKVMTALVALESGSPHAEVLVGPESVHPGPAALGLRPGDRLELRDLIAAMLIASANDACLAVAHQVGGDEAGFVARMNRRASALGLRDTHFANPCGFDASAQYASAEDLARLTLVALRHPTFAMMVRTTEVEIATLDGARRFRLVNTNRLLGEPEVTGVKTGFTSKAGYCLIVLASRNGRTLLVVGLGFRDRWEGALALLGYGFRLLESPPGREARPG